MNVSEETAFPLVLDLGEIAARHGAESVQAAQAYARLMAWRSPKDAPAASAMVH